MKLFGKPAAGRRQQLVSFGAPVLLGSKPGQLVAAPSSSSGISGELPRNAPSW
jgi:hypothetical protein